MNQAIGQRFQNINGPHNVVQLQLSLTNSVQSQNTGTINSVQQYKDLVEGTKIPPQNTQDALLSGFSFT
ncbi:36167_t:CDS:2 [Gigaspora margarita]|uniref:36167_t:CDS:1 n=1 Tax=Gigaspora margarita TaxID=4874 RepID=A0ABN7W7T1_GIGMA|nr:36167_t:CDS:2 [Gigaspora margarita]